MTVLGAVITRIAAVLRAIALTEMVVQLLIWHSFYLASPWLLWAPAVALTWGCAVIGYLRRHRRPRWQLACADTAVYAVLALAATWCVPVAMRGVAGSWLFILLASQLVVPVWFAPQALSLPLALTTGLAFGAGAALAPASPQVTTNTRDASLALLFAVMGVHWCGRRMLYGRACRADAALAAADQDARDQYVILSRNIEQREQDRLLHDTILNTLTAIARSGGTAEVISRCRQDIGLLERALGEPGDAGASGPPDAGPLAAIDAVAGEMRARGLAVDLAVAGSVPAGRGTQPGVPVPGPVVAAMAQATREALANVAAHAGTGQACVTVSLAPPDEGDGPGLFQVTVRDAGTGFDPARVDPARLGVRRSIKERVEDWNGSASVQSAPGQGTVVCLSWPADRSGLGRPGRQAAGGPRAQRGQGQW
jgi:signal transduction histidine kinase